MHDNNVKQGTVVNVSSCDMFVDDDDDLLYFILCECVLSESVVPYISYTYCFVVNFWFLEFCLLDCVTAGCLLSCSRHSSGTPFPSLAIEPKLQIYTHTHICIHTCIAPTHMYTLPLFVNLTV